MLIPIKSFDLAKGRLAEALDPERRALLARQMAANVIRAAVPLPVWVVCGDHHVADFARAQGAHVIWRPPKGLNRAITDGTEALASRGVVRAVIAHADLPLAVDLSFLVPSDRERTDGRQADTHRTNTVVLVPDRHDDGSNVMSIPLDRGFQFHYGPGSFAAHQAEAARLGLAVEVVRDERLGWDIDVPDDLAALDRAVFDSRTPDGPAPVGAASDDSPTHTRSKDSP